MKDTEHPSIVWQPRGCYTRAASNGGNILTAEGKRETKIKAIGSPFDVKDTLKDRNYRWDADEKVWHTTVAPEQEPEERTFLSMTYARGGDRAPSPT